MRLVFTIIFITFFIAQNGFTQQQQTDQAQPTVIDLTELGKTYTISARMELPQVRMFDRRLTPDFKQVSAEKSFESELSPEVEVIKYEPITSGKVKQIDEIDKLLNKKRF
jgi:hypothetical protein